MKNTVPGKFFHNLPTFINKEARAPGKPSFWHTGFNNFSDINFYLFASSGVTDHQGDAVLQFTCRRRHHQYSGRKGRKLDTVLPKMKATKYN